MIIDLQRLPASLPGPQGDGYNGQVPERFRLMMPDAAASLLQLERDTSSGIILTDIYRAPPAQFAAHRAKSGTQPVGYSFHGYGGALDADVGATLRRLGTNYPKLVDLLGKYGYFCHRRDLDPTASESWHFNYLGLNADWFLKQAAPQNHATWARPAESRIQSLFGADFTLDRAGVIDALIKAGVGGVHDDSPDDVLKVAVRIFQRDWDLQVDGICGPVTQRVLSYVTATLNIVELPNA